MRRIQMTTPMILGLFAISSTASGGGFYLTSGLKSSSPDYSSDSASLGLTVDF